jgi:NAD(P)-dependent dehydrogenase (short-subunit alcohol dehydrogenase family)
MKLEADVAAVVTGGASGLGEATARALAARGVRVAILDRNVDLGQSVANDIGGLFCEVDITSEADVERAFVKARGAHGQERVLINCAGIAHGEKTASRDKSSGAAIAHRFDAFVRVIQVNLIGTFLSCARSAAGMIDADPIDGERGVIVNTASVAAVEGQIGQAAYSASKGGVLGMMVPMARDLMTDGIRVNTILPGIVQTSMVAQLPQNVQEALAASIPFPRRLGRPEEFAALACSMIENSYINAAAVRLDGALRMAPR